MAKALKDRVSMDEALEETKFGRYNYLLILVSGFILINVVLECIGISFVLPVINCDIKLSYQEKGVLGAVSFLGMISSAHLWGFLSDTKGRRSVMRPTLIIGYLVTILSSLSPNFLTLAILRFVNGVLISGGSGTVFAYLGEFHCNKTRNRALMSAGFISAFMGIFFPIVAWVAINQDWSFNVPLLDIVYKPWRMYFVVVGIPGLVCGLCLYILPESPKFLLSVGREEEAVAILKKIYKANTGKNSESYKINSILPDIEEEVRCTNASISNGSALRTIIRSMWDQTAPLFMGEHCRKTVLACVIQFWSFFTAHGLYMWFPFILNRVMRFTSENPSVRMEMCEIMYQMEDVPIDPANSTADIDDECNQNLELSTYTHSLGLELIYVALFLVVGFFTGKIGRIPTLFSILFFTGICGILSAFITIPIVAVYLLVVLLICGVAITVLNTITVDLFPTHLRAMAVCISLMIGRIGSVTGTNVVGALLEHHCKTSLLLCSITLISGGFLVFLLPLPKRVQPGKQKETQDKV